MKTAAHIAPSGDDSLKRASCADLIRASLPWDARVKPGHDEKRGYVALSAASHADGANTLIQQVSHA